MESSLAPWLCRSQSVTPLALITMQYSSPKPCNSERFESYFPRRGSSKAIVQLTREGTQLPFQDERDNHSHASLAGYAISRPRIIPIPPIHVIKTYGPTLIQPQKRSAQPA